jgi:ribosomal protein S3
VIGRKGEDIEKLRVEVARLMKMAVPDVRLNIAEIRKPELDAQLVAESIAQQIEKRVMFRRAMKRSVTNTMRSGALGVKVRIAGRLNGAEISRSEWTREGRIPLHTFRADIDYGLAEARTTYGVIGVKVWFKGEVFDREEPEAEVVEGADKRSWLSRRPAERRGSPGHDATEADQVPQDVQGQPLRHGDARQLGRVRRLRAEGDGSLAHDRS